MAPRDTLANFVHNGIHCIFAGMVAKRCWCIMESWAGFSPKTHIYCIAHTSGVLDPSEMSSTQNSISAACQTTGHVHALAPVTSVLTTPQEAQKALAEAKKDIKTTSKELNAQLADMEDSLTTQLRRAERENSTVYLMRVPNIADLPAIQPHSVAKCASSSTAFKC